MHLVTHVDLLNLSSRYKDPVKLYIVSCISNRLIRELQHLVSYASRHNAMAYDTAFYKIGHDMSSSYSTPPHSMLPT
jgi:hypothetical protein